MGWFICKRIDAVPPTLALLTWLVLLLALLYFDPAKEPKTSVVLWVPAIWMFIIASRLPSQWLGYQVAGFAAQAFQEGNPMDRTVWVLLILAAVGILISRSFQWGNFFMRNLALIAFLSFALLSVMWSDFPYITFKHWFRDLGSYLVILVVLSDPRPLEAVRTVFRRLAYLLIPLSVTLVKYFPYMAVQYDPWTGERYCVGPTTSKNMLGALCLISGIFFFWDTVERWSERKESRTRRIILVNVAFMGMTLWLLHLASSATSTVCLVIGCLVIAAVHTKMGKSHLGFLMTLAPGSFFLYLILALGLGMNGILNGLVGRAANFTDRTLIWDALLDMHTNPVVGTGYQSFWLGSRLAWLWQHGMYINEAHNGYLEVYLELGLIGLLLLCLFLIASYRRICRRFDTSMGFSSLALATWTMLIFYNVTEAAFGGGVLWMLLVLGSVNLPEPIGNRTRCIPEFDAYDIKSPAEPSLEITVQH